jgi:hypothetical protein
VSGRSSSCHKLAEKPKGVVRATPLVGETLKTPGRGAPFVIITTLDVNAFESSMTHVSVKARKEFAGRAFGLSAKLYAKLASTLLPEEPVSVCVIGVCK